MATKWFPGVLSLLVLSLIINLWLVAPNQADEHDRKAYIVYMGHMATPDIPAADVYLNMIKEVLGGSDPLNVVSKAEEHLLHTFKNFHGCLAYLTEEEAEKISGMTGVVSVFPNQKNHLHTTRSWDFMDFPLNVERSSYESDVIIGVIDSGVWPESESFTDEGFSPPPAKWKGRCDTAYNFTCNNKIIGAQYFKADGNFSTDDIESARDSNGHGTHTASTAAGGVVSGASFQGLGIGTARGAVPSARIAVYKVCWSDRCHDADILAAFDAAISDGVDIISLSVGGTAVRPYFKDAIAIGAFHAMKYGILTSASAGNSGPGLQTLGNYAPWHLTVAASTIDRKFTTEVQLGNGMVVEGISLNTFDPKHKTFPLIYGVDAQNISSPNRTFSRNCNAGSLNTTLVKDKIVICDNLNNGEVPFIAGAAGLIMQGLSSHDGRIPFPLPASYLRVDDGARIVSYARNLSSTPYATILKSVGINDTSAPIVGEFSSRGPNIVSPGILKPDITAPGVSILAAFSPIAPVTQVTGDPRSVQYNILKGTSMSCPHVSGVAAYVKSFHPSWSPAAIKSALMTTAFPMSSTSNPQAEFAYGSGHVSPLKAVNPGLVYDAGEDDYVNFLCNEGLNAAEISFISGKDKSCSSKTAKRTSSWDLNYPSMALSTSAGAFDAVFYRTVTNVGSPNSTYHATVTTPEGNALAIKVKPSTLTFTTVGQKSSYTVRVLGSIGMRNLMSASLVWDDGEHQVRSPIVVYNLA